MEGLLGAGGFRARRHGSRDNRSHTVRVNGYQFV